jgi:hypothetical protein
LDYQTTSYKPITNAAWVRARLCELQKWRTRFAAASDKVYQLLAHGRWFSPASSTSKTDHHDITEILLKVALNTIKSINQSILRQSYCLVDCVNFKTIHDQIWNMIIEKKPTDLP